MRLALDCQVSYAVAAKLREAGHEVVYHAHQEHDEFWLPRAKELGAQVFVSPDFDVENFALNSGLDFIKVKQGYKKDKLLNYILGRLNDR